MNKIGIYYAYWEHNWDANFIPYVDKVARLGFDILEVNSGTVTNMSLAERDQLKRAAECAGIELTFCIGLSQEYDIAAEDTTVRKRGIDFLKRQAEMLQYMGGRELGGIIYGAWPATLPSDCTDKRPYLERSISAMKEVMKTVEDCGVWFHIEVVNRFEQYLINTCEEALTYVELVGSEHLRILLDTFHMNIEEDSFHGAIIHAGDNLRHIHLGETNRRAPGSGRIPWYDIVTTLRQIQYSGSLVMEPFLMPGGEVGRDIKVFRDLRGDLDLDTEARRALTFMREKLNSAAGNSRQG